MKGSARLHRSATRQFYENRTPILLKIYARATTSSRRRLHGQVTRRIWPFALELAICLDKPVWMSALA
jgi:hypothetical protein